MIEEEAIMTVRENVHQLVDTLPEDRLADVLDYLYNHDLQRSIAIRETRAGLIENLVEKALIKLPAHIMEHHTLLGWLNLRFRKYDCR
jgi:hypothetical protein